MTVTHIRGTAVALGAAAVVLAGCADSSGEGGSGAFPGSEGAAIIVAAGPGGGTDVLARQINEAFSKEEVVPSGVTVENIDAGAGVGGRAAMRDRGDAGKTIVVDGNRIYMAYLTGQDEASLDEYTPVAKMTSDYIVWAVRADSKWTDVSALLEALEESPKTVSFGVGSIPGNDYFGIIGPAQTFVDPSDLNIVAFDAGAEVVTNLLGGHVDVVASSLSEMAQQAEAGEVRLLSVSAAEPLTGQFADVPTWQEVGVDFSLDHWRGLFGPADMSEEALEWWDSKLAEVVETETWKNGVESQTLTTTYEPSSEFAESLEGEIERNAEFLDRMGLLQVQP